MSGRKNVLTPHRFITDGVMTGVAAITSEVIVISFMDNVGIQLIWTGTAVGTFAVQVSNNYHKTEPGGAVSNSGTWTTIPLDPAIAAAGSADNAFIDLNQMGACAVRVVYTNSSGTGVLNGYVSAKAL